MCCSDVDNGKVGVVNMFFAVCGRCVFVYVLGWCDCVYVCSSVSGVDSCEWC